MVRLTRQEAFATCEDGIQYPVLIDACEALGLGIQVDLHSSKQYLLVSLQTGYCLTEDFVLSYFQAFYWLERLAALSQERGLDWRFSIEAFSRFSPEEREAYEQVLYATLQQARSMPKDLLC